jgi:hypothetical protein
VVSDETISWEFSAESRPNQIATDTVRLFRLEIARFPLENVSEADVVYRFL